MNGKFEYELDEFMKRFPDVKDSLERIMGKGWSDYNTKLRDKVQALEICVNELKDKREYQRKKEIAFEVVDHFLTGLDNIVKEAVIMNLEGQKEISENFLKGLDYIATKTIMMKLEGEKQIAEKITGPALRSIAGSINEQTKMYKQIYSQLAKAMEKISMRPTPQLPAHKKQEGLRLTGDIGDCPVQNPHIRSPKRNVYTFESNGELYQFCSVAYYTHKRTWLKLHIINEPVAQEAGCPLHGSRHIIGRFIPRQRCYLLSGWAHKMKIEKAGMPMF